MASQIKPEWPGRPYNKIINIIKHLKSGHFFIRKLKVEPTTRVMKNSLILFILTFMISLKGASQSEFSISLGLGFPELLNAGVSYEMAPVKFGAGIGTAFGGAYALSGDFYYHFGGRAQYSKMPPWYVRGNLTWWQFNKILFFDLGNVVLLGFRCGRDFNIAESFGISIDGGIIPFSFFSGKKIPFSFIPTAGVSMYYRLGTNKTQIRGPGVQSQD
jgi:hypothetical protein